MSCEGGCQGEYGPPTTIDSRFNHWSHRAFWTRAMTTLLTQVERPDDLSIDNTAMREHRPPRPRGEAQVQAIGRWRAGQATDSTRWQMVAGVPSPSSSTRGTALTSRLLRPRVFWPIPVVMRTACGRVSTPPKPRLSSF